MTTEIIDEILQSFFISNENSDIQIALDYLKEMFEYTTIGGKGTRGKIIINSYKYLCGNNYDDYKLKQSEVIGFCIEILQAGFLLHDDIMDHGLLRRQKRCWYLNAQDRGYGLIGVNDGLFLNTIVHRILMKFFRTEDFFIDLIDVFTDTCFRTCTGQCLDMVTSSTIADLSLYTSERYRTIVAWKTAYYSFCLPVKCAFAMAQLKDKSLFADVEKILLKVGEYFQIQDDFLDCYGDPNLLGKIGCDIEERKCSWLIVQALQLGNQSQVDELKAIYGQNNADSVKRVKEIYNKLELERLFHEYEDQVYAEINDMIADFAKVEGNGIPSEIFTDLVKAIHKRKK